LFFAMSQMRARLTVSVVSVRSVVAGGWRFVGRARHVGRGGQEEKASFPPKKATELIAPPALWLGLLGIRVISVFLAKSP
jgi:hypothetical protein